MRKLTLAAALIGTLVLAGCKSSGSKKLAGQWRGQKAEGVPETAQASANEFAERTEIRAQGNQITISTPNGAPQPAATYTVDKEDATTLVIHTDRDRVPETFAFDDAGTTMVWKMDDKRSLTFRKVSPASTSSK